MKNAIRIERGTIVTPFEKLFVNDEVYLVVNDGVLACEVINDYALKGRIVQIAEDKNVFAVEQAEGTIRPFSLEETVSIGKHAVAVIPVDDCKKEVYSELEAGRIVMLSTKSTIELFSRKDRQKHNRYPKNAMFNLYFEDVFGNEDSTQFTTEGGKWQDVFEELLLFWKDFRAENHFFGCPIYNIEYVGIDEEAE